MSVQEIKQRIYHLVDENDNEVALGQLLQNANELLTDQPATLADLTPEQRTRLDNAIQQHRDGKTVSNETVLEAVNRILSVSLDADVREDLTDEQIDGIEKARQEYRQGEGISVNDMKHKLEQKWPQLKSR